jgi:molybdenum cofactor synthesis domain-containing protein
MQLIADGSGLFRVDVPLLERINAIGDITIATIPDHYPVEKGARLASMRIVPLVTQAAQIEKAEALLRETPLLRLLPYARKKVGVIVTGSEIYHGRIQDKFEPVIRAKLRAFPAELLGVTLCDDDTEMIAAYARAYLAKGAELLLFTGGMSVDPDDLTPAAIRALGAEVISYGVPSQPGNMTLVAYLEQVAILGVPGAAIHLPTTVLDVLLPQLFTDERITKEDLVRLGGGGLCQLCETCHYPNCTFGRY